ncbi:MAG: 16S rRNA (uracil(1498)-N(3))-methyltransferase [Cyanobacteria bacterium P01_A01_bin.84]
MTQLQRIAIAPSQMQQGKIVLREEQLHYLCRVLRLRPGNNFIAMDGLGKWWLTQLGENEATVIEELDNYQRELPIPITLIVALPKNGFDEIVRCCTELGVTSIIPVISDRTLLKPSPQKLQRWQRIAREAAEQSERSVIPNVSEPVAFQSALSSIASPDNHSSTSKYLCAARGDSTHFIDSFNKVEIPRNNQSYQQHQIIIVTGPEGGWTEAEIKYAVDIGFITVSLGARILRAATAPIAALSVIAAILESESVRF